MAQQGSSSAVSRFNPEQLSEEDIENIWMSMMAGKETTKVKDAEGKSVETTPATGKRTAHTVLALDLETTVFL